MSLHDLPNELLHMIASDAVSNESSLDILLLFKRWHAVASALFYHTITLRSTDQTKALARTLTSKPDLALHIKRLRFNGGYGAAAATVLRAVPHLAHLCLALGVFSKENVNPMCAALKHVNPTRVSLYDNREDHENKKTVQLMRAVCQCIDGPWSNMVRLLISSSSLNQAAYSYKQKRFDFPYHICYSTVPRKKYAALVESLITAPNLHVLYVPCADGFALTPLARISSNTFLQVVVCRIPPSSVFDEAAQRDATGRLRALAKFPGEDYGTNSLPLFFFAVLIIC